MQQEFQSSPGTLTGCDYDTLAADMGMTEFQSSPGTLTGCDARIRAQGVLDGQFQSSPGTLTGCDDVRHRYLLRRGQLSFNPHPAR